MNLINKHNPVYVPFQSPEVYATCSVEINGEYAHALGTDPRCQSTVPPHGSHHVCQRDSLGHRTSVHCSVGVSYQSIGECHTAQTVPSLWFQERVFTLKMLSFG